MTEDMWGTGDYKAVADKVADIGEVLVRRADIGPGMEVVDVACGAGNATIPAAKLGARVTGLDFSPGLLALGAMYHAKCLVSAAAVLVRGRRTSWPLTRPVSLAAIERPPRLVPLTSKFRNCSFQRDPLGVGYGLRQRRCAHRHERIQPGYRGRASCDRGAQHSLHSEADPGAPGGRPNLRRSGDPGVAGAELFTDGVGSATVSIQDAMMPGATGAWVSIDGPPPARPGHRRVLHLRGARLPRVDATNPVEPVGPHRILFRRVLLALDRDALRLGALVGTGDPYGQHTCVIRRRDRVAGDVCRQLERPPERPVADLAERPTVLRRDLRRCVRRGAHHE